MVQEEGRIAGAGKRIEPKAADGEVSASMDTIQRLEDAVEATEVGAARYGFENVRRLGLIRPDKGKVSRETARVVTKATVGADRLESDRAKIDRCICKRTGLDAATASPGRDRKTDAEGSDTSIAVRDAFAVASHGVRRAIEHGGPSWVLPVYGPVPVWLRAFVSALISKGFLVEPSKVTMEVEEQPLSRSEPRLPRIPLQTGKGHMLTLK